MTAQKLYEWLHDHLNRKYGDEKLDGNSSLTVFLIDTSKGEKFVGEIEDVAMTWDDNMVLYLDPEDSDVIKKKKKGAK